MCKTRTNAQDGGGGALSKIEGKEEEKGGEEELLNRHQGTKERRRVFTVAVENNRKEEEGEEEEGEHPHCATTEAESSLVRCNAVGSHWKRRREARLEIPADIFDSLDFRTGEER